jgi:hypothetical protein
MGRGERREEMLRFNPVTSRKQLGKTLYENLINRLPTLISKIMKLRDRREAD